MWQKRASAVLFFVCCGSVMESSPASVGREAPESCVVNPSVTRVRACDRNLQVLVQSGHDRSPAFRQLLADLEASRWIVFVQPGRCPAKEMVGCLLTFVGRFEDSPFMRVLVKTHTRHADQVITTLAGELQHALQVAQDPTVVDVPTMLAMFKRVGRDPTATATPYATSAARKMRETVLRELREKNASTESTRK